MTCFVDVPDIRHWPPAELLTATNAVSDSASHAESTHRHGGAWVLKSWDIEAMQQVE